MKTIFVGLAILGLLSACGGGGMPGVKLGSVGGVNADAAVGAAADLGKAATLTDEEVKASALQMRDYEEKNQEKVAAPASKYAKRLAKLTDNYKSYDGLKLNFKAYESDQVNANATADGSVRVYTALMDLMDDNELQFVIGHEIGHVKNGHSAKEMRTALAMSGARKGAEAAGGMAGQLAASQLGGLLEAVLNAQYSQAQETESDDYGLAFLRKSGGKLTAAESSLRKLAKLSGGKHSMLSSHPEPNARADRIAALAKK